MNIIPFLYNMYFVFVDVQPFLHFLIFILENLLCFNAQNCKSAVLFFVLKLFKKPFIYFSCVCILYVYINDDSVW